MQCVAVRCVVSTQMFVIPCRLISVLWCVLQCVAVCCSLLQCVAVCVAACCSALHGVNPDVCHPMSTHQCLAVCCSVFCSVLQRVAACCSVLQRVAVRCVVSKQMFVTPCRLDDLCASLLQRSLLQKSTTKIHFFCQRALLHI